MNVYEEYCDYDRLKDIACIGWCNDGLTISDVDIDEDGLFVQIYMNSLSIDDLDNLSGNALPDSYIKYINGDFNSADESRELVKATTEINRLIESVIGQTEKYISMDFLNDFNNWYSRNFDEDVPSSNFGVEVVNISYYSNDEIKELREEHKLM